LIFVVYALYALLAPSLPVTWPVPPLDLLLVGVARSRAHAGKLVVGTALVDALVGTPSPWLRWLLRMAALGLWGRGRAALSISVFGWCVLLAPGRGPVHLLVLTSCSALLAWWVQPAAPLRRRGWGWHA
jgi:hypothetical protein